jgi:hypothetical protein
MLTVMLNQPTGDFNWACFIFLAITVNTNNGIKEKDY